MTCFYMKCNTGLKWVQIVDNAIERCGRRVMDRFSLPLKQFMKPIEFSLLCTVYYTFEANNKNK